MTETPTLRKKPAPLLSLNAQVDAKGQVDSRIPIRWCVSKQLIEALEQQGFKNPQMLLVVRHKRGDSVGGHSIYDYTDTDHLVVPITQELAYVSFSRPGKNEIVPMIVDVRDKRDAKILGALRHGADVYHTVIAADGSLSYAMEDISWDSDERSSRLKHLQTHFTLAVNVPKEMFAPEPSDKAKALVNRFFRGKGADQCGFRKRRIVSTLWVLPFMLLGTIAKLVLILGALLLTKREYNLRHLLHPFSGSVSGVIDDTEENTLFWWQEKNGRKRNPLFFVFNHIGLFAIPAIGFAFMHGTDDKTHKQYSYWGWWKTFFVVNSFYVGVAVAGLVLFGLFVGITALGGLFSDSPRFAARKERQRAAQQSADARRAEEVLRELKAMVCTTDSLTRPPSLKDLPKNKLTVSLVFNGIKTGVCKPFAK